jgi:hypothetical protein
MSEGDRLVRKAQGTPDGRGESKRQTPAVWRFY